MTWEVNVTATNQVVTSIVSTTNVIITPPDYTNVSIDETTISVAVTNTTTDLKLYFDAIELRLADLSTFWRGEWVSGTGYIRGDIVSYNNSLFFLKAFDIDITAVYVSTIPPMNITSGQELDTTHWARLVWHEAPFDHIQVTNTATFAGTASFAGLVNFADQVTIQKTLTVNSTTNLRNTNITGDISVTGSARIGSRLTATGMVNFLNSLTVANSITGGSDLSVTGNITGQGQLTIAQTATLNDTDVLGYLNIGGNISAGRGLTVASTSSFLGTATFGNSVTILDQGQFTVNSTATFNNFLTALGSARIVNTLTTKDLIADSLSIGGSASGNQLTITGNTLLNGNLRVTGTSTLTNVTINGLLTASNTASFTSIKVSGTSTFTGSAYFNAPNTYVKNIIVENNLVAGDTYYPTSRGLNTQFLMTDGAGNASWQYLGVGSIWTLFTDLTTLGYNIKSGINDGVPNDLSLWTGGDPAIQAQTPGGPSNIKLHGNGQITFTGTKNIITNGSEEIRLNASREIKLTSSLSTSNQAIQLSGNTQVFGQLRSNSLGTKSIFSSDGGSIAITATTVYFSGDIGLSADRGIDGPTNNYLHFGSDSDITLGSNSQLILGSGSQIEFGDGTILTSAISTSSQLTVKDENQTITTDLRSLDFVGSGVTVSAYATATNLRVSIPGLTTLANSTTITNTTTAINFTGAGVSTSLSGGTVTVNISGGGGGGGDIIIYDEGSTLTNTVTSINFVGSGVTASANGNNITVDIGSQAGSNVKVYDESTEIESDLRTLKFIGNGVAATKVSTGTVNVTINQTGDLDATKDAYLNGYKLKNTAGDSSYLQFQGGGDKAYLQGWNQVEILTSGVSIFMDNIYNAYAMDLQATNIIRNTTKDFRVNASDYINLNAHNGNILINSRGSTTISSTATSSINAPDIEVTAAKNLVLTANTLTFSFNTLNLGTGSSILLNANPVRIGPNTTNSNLWTERIYNRNGNGPPLFPSGVRYADGTVQYTAFVANLGQLPPLIDYKGTTSTASAENFENIVPIPEYFDAIVTLDTQHLWIYTVYGPVNGWFDASA